MSAGLKRNRSVLVEMYQNNLERRIQQGGYNLVCRDDEELFREVESLLSTGAAQDIYSLLGLDPLSVMEASLQALPTTSGQSGLEKLARAFEVLELAALNLYLCPWRKEYRAVKMFSGMFTHYVKPALTAQQVKELFGLLGYHSAVSGEEEELKLSSKPVHADTLLQLACAFFSARVECQLLLSSVTSLDSCVQWELQLVLERKHGHSLHTAQENAKRKLESASQSSEPDLTADIDIYTDAYTPPKDTPWLHRTSNSLRDKKSDDSTSGAMPVCVSTLNCHISSISCPSSTHNAELGLNKHFGNAHQVTPVADAQISVSRMKQQMCICSKYELDADRCSEIHRSDCPCFRSCQEQGLDLRPTEQSRLHVPSQTTQTRGWEQPYKPQNLRKHKCMSKPTSDVFQVCYDCYNIHDFKCDDLKNCYHLRHNLQNTGRLQPPQGERGVMASPKRHTCLEEKAIPYVVCHTCNQSHDCLCKEVQQCEGLAHVVKYLVEMNKEMEADLENKPIVNHQCCTDEKPELVCLTCKVFHVASCNIELCSRKHDVQNLKSVCSRCSEPNIHIMCQYCCAQCCKKCWFQSPINCRCGMPYAHSSPV